MGVVKMGHSHDMDMEQNCIPSHHVRFLSDPCPNFVRLVPADFMLLPQKAQIPDWWHFSAKTVHLGSWDNCCYHCSFFWKASKATIEFPPECKLKFLLVTVNSTFLGSLSTFLGYPNGYVYVISCKLLSNGIPKNFVPRNSSGFLLSEYIFS